MTGRGRARRRRIFRRLCLVLLAAILYVLWGNASIETDNAVYTSDALPAAFDGLRIAQLSDLHCKEFGADNTRLYAAVERAAPELGEPDASGRRRPIPELKMKNPVQRGFGERTAMKHPMQGSAADIIKIAMVRVRDRLRREGLESHLILQVHDELIIEAPLKEKDIAARILTEEMENAFQMDAPLVAEAKSGMSWYDAK